MGYKAKIRELNQVIEMMRRQRDAAYAAVKQIVVEKGNTDDGMWKMEIPIFIPEVINEKYEMQTEQNQYEDMYIIRVRERKDEKA